jgi:UDP-N-acetyl-D-mannosaminuronate dehydrogenase
VAESLAELGADVRVADPHLRAENVPFVLVELTADAVSAADAVVIVTDHDGFDYELVGEHAQFVLDTRNRITGPNVELL